MSSFIGISLHRKYLKFEFNGYAFIRYDMVTSVLPYWSYYAINTTLYCNVCRYITLQKTFINLLKPVDLAVIVSEGRMSLQALQASSCE